MCEASMIKVYRKDVTDKLIDYIIQLDALGSISLDTTIKREANETWAEFFTRKNWWERGGMVQQVRTMFNIEPVLNDEYITIHFDHNGATDNLIDNFRQFGVDLLFWFESCDGFNADEWYLTADGRTYQYDVDYDEGASFIYSDLIHMIREYPPHIFKTVVLDMLERTSAFNGSPLVAEPLKDVIQPHKVASVLTELDEGRMEAKEAFSLIRSIRAEIEEDPMFLVFVDSEYVDAQAYIQTPDGEFGGEGYVELYRSYPILIGRYKCKSAREAIKLAATEFGASEEVLYAEQVKTK